MVLALALLGADGYPVLGQSGSPKNGRLESDPVSSIVSTAAIRPLIFDPDLVTRRPTPLVRMMSPSQPKAAPVFFVSLSPALHSGRMQSQRKPLTLKIRRQVSAVRWVQPADPFDDAAVVQQVNGGASQAKRQP